MAARLVGPPVLTQAAARASSREAPLAAVGLARAREALAAEREQRVAAVVAGVAARPWAAPYPQVLPR